MDIKPSSKAARYIVRALKCLEDDLEFEIEHETDDNALADAGNDHGYVQTLIAALEAEIIGASEKENEVTPS
jgi:hypothetical protein